MFLIEEVAVPATVAQSAGLVNAWRFPNVPPSAPHQFVRHRQTSRLKTSRHRLTEHEIRMSWRLRACGGSGLGTDRQVGTFRVWLAANVCASMAVTVRLDFPPGWSLGRRLPIHPSSQASASASLA
jgi:hypothetical protein